MAGKSYFQSIGGNLIVRSATASTDIEFMGGGSIAQMTLKSTGNLLIGSTTDDTLNVLQVTGDTALTGNLVISGTAKRITGLMDGTPRGNRLYFQTSTTNGNTNFGIIPNGTAVQAVQNIYNSSSDQDNCGLFQLLINSTNSILTSTYTGTGTALPLIIRVGAVAIAMTIDTSNNVEFGAAVSFGSRTGQLINLYSTSYGIGVQSGTLYQRTSGGYAWHKGGVHSDTANDPGSGGTCLMKLDSSGNLDALASFKVNATQVVGARKTGWTAMTGTATRTAIPSDTPTNQQLGRCLKALIDDLITHGLLGA
jgi:hypothetical protein